MASLVRLATIARRHLLRDHGHRREKARRSPARDGGNSPSGVEKRASPLHVRCDKENVGARARDIISSDVAESRPTRGERGTQHHLHARLRAKSVGEVAADIGETRAGFPALSVDD